MPTRPFDFLDLLLHRFRRGRCAQRRQKTLAVDDDRDRKRLDTVALAYRLHGLRIELVVGEILAPLVGALGLISAVRLARLVRHVLLDANWRALLRILLAAALLHHTQRALDLGIRIEIRFVRLPLVEVEARCDADLEIVEA